MSAAAPAHANPVRNVRCFRPGRVVSVRLTDFAKPGTSGRLLTLYGPSVDQAVRTILQRLEIPAAELDLRPQQMGDVAVLRRMPADVPAEYAPGKIMPVAFVEGLALHDFAEALQWAAPRISAAA